MCLYLYKNTLSSCSCVYFLKKIHTRLVYMRYLKYATFKPVFNGRWCIIMYICSFFNIKEICAQISSCWCLKSRFGFVWIHLIYLYESGCCLDSPNLFIRRKIAYLCTFISFSLINFNFHKSFFAKNANYRRLL